MLRRLYHEQPESFAFTPANQAWAEAQITKYPEGRQASAVIPLLWRAQEQEGWVTRPIIETVAKMLGMAEIRVLEVASFYFMFQLQPVGSVAHIQVCGTLSCMICGAEDLIAVCKEKIAEKPHTLSSDGKFSWEEVECLGACANAPMAQIGKDYYEDLTAARFGEIIDELAAGKVPMPGPQNGRYAAEPLSGLTSLTEFDSGKAQYNASAQLAADLGETVKRIDGTEVPILTPWLDRSDKGSFGGKRAAAKKPAAAKPEKAKDESAAPAKAGAAKVSSGTSAKASVPKTSAPKAKAAPKSGGADYDGDGKPEGKNEGKKPRTMKAPRKAGADDLKLIKGVGPKLEKLCNSLGFWHFDQIAKWTDAEVAWVDANLEGFRGRVSRDEWVAQAEILAAGGDTEFSAKNKK